MEIIRIEDTNFFDVRNSDSEKSFAIKIGDLIQLAGGGNPINLVGFFKGFKSNLIQLSALEGESDKSDDFIDIKGCTFCIRLASIDELRGAYKELKIIELELEIEKLESRIEFSGIRSSFSEEKEIKYEALIEKNVKLEKAIIAQGIVIAEKMKNKEI